MEDRRMILTAVGNVISDWFKRYDLIWSSRLGRFEQSTVTSSLESLFEERELATLMSANKKSSTRRVNNDPPVGEACVFGVEHVYGGQVNKQNLSEARLSRRRRT